MNTRFNTALIVFLVFTIVPLFMYLSFLYSKITSPHIKNGTNKEFIYAGVMVALLIIADYFVVRKLIKQYIDN